MTPLYVHTRDILKLWSEFLENFKSSILLDKQKGYIYIRNFLWYTDKKLTEDKQPILEKIIREHLPKEDKEDIMRTIAQKYRDEGIQIGQEKGKIEGKMEGEKEKAISIAKAMREKNYPLEDIMLLTGLSRAHIETLL